MLYLLIEVVTYLFTCLSKPNVSISQYTCNHKKQNFSSTYRKKKLESFVSYLSFFFSCARPSHSLNFRVIQCEGHCCFWKLHTYHFQSMCGGVSCQLQCNLVSFEGITKATIIVCLNRSISFPHLQSQVQTFFVLSDLTATITFPESLSYSPSFHKPF